jgi:hypothetical protein
MDRFRQLPLLLLLAAEELQWKHSSRLCRDRRIRSFIARSATRVLRCNESNKSRLARSDLQEQAALFPQQAAMAKQGEEGSVLKLMVSAGMTQQHCCGGGIPASSDSSCNQLCLIEIHCWRVGACCGAR